MRLLPVHMLKLKWLLANISHIEKYSKPNAKYLRDLKSLLESQAEIDTLALILLEGLYDTYQTFLKEKKHV